MKRNMKKEPCSKRHIQCLLYKYMAGETTLEEEQILSEYFRDADLPEEWADYHEMFAWLEQGMDERYLTTQDSNCSIAPQRQRQNRPAPRLMRCLFPWIAAACIAGGLLWKLWPIPQQETGHHSEIAQTPTASTPQSQCHYAVKAVPLHRKGNAITALREKDSERSPNATAKSTSRIIQKTDNPTDQEPRTKQEHEAVNTTENIKNQQLIQESLSLQLQAIALITNANVAQVQALILQSRSSLVMAKMLIEEQESQEQVSPTNTIEV